MPKKEFNQLAYQNKYISEKYDRINLTVPKGKKAEIKERAAAVGESVNEYINKAIAIREKVAEMEEVNRPGRSWEEIEAEWKKLRAEEKVVEIDGKLYLRQ